VNLETFDFSAQQLQQLEEFSSDPRLVLCLLGSLFYGAMRELDQLRALHETE
jgi:hypothetical protein